MRRLSDDHVDAGRKFIRRQLEDAARLAADAIE
jgi:hypothetical protein